MATDVGKGGEGEGGGTAAALMTQALYRDHAINQTAEHMSEILSEGVGRIKGRAYFYGENGKPLGSYGLSFKDTAEKKGVFRGISDTARKNKCTCVITLMEAHKLVVKKPEDIGGEVGDHPDATHCLSTTLRGPEVPFEVLISDINSVQVDCGCNDPDCPGMTTGWEAGKQEWVNAGPHDDFIPKWW